MQQAYARQREVTSDARDCREPNIKNAAFALATFSIFYFCYVLLLASDRYFWIDEISTALIASAPNVRAIWDSPKHIPDFLPAAYYLIVRLSRAIFGHGLLGTRMPSIVGMYALCVCLFVFVWKRVGVLGGTVAMLFPLVTGSFAYSFEARPYGIEMGFAGLALLCWQFSEDTNSSVWTVGFALSLFAALCVHAFAFCLVAVFFIPEVLLFLNGKRIFWPRVAAIAVPAAIATLTYLPVLAGFRSATSRAQFATAGSIVVARAAEGSLASTYEILLGHTLAVLLICVSLVVTSLAVHWPVSLKAEESTTPPRDFLIAFGFLCGPFVAISLAVIEKSQYFPRYVSWSVAGIALLLGLCAGSGMGRKASSIAMVVLLSLVVCRSFATPAFKRLQGQVLTTYAPGDEVVSYIHAGHPMELHELLRTDLPDVPIVTASLQDFIYIEYYSATLGPRVRYIYSSETDYGIYYINGCRDYLHVRFNAPIKSDRVLRTVPHFFYYGIRGEPSPELMTFIRAGARVLSFELSADGTHFLAELRSGHEV